MGCAVRAVACVPMARRSVEVFGDARLTTQLHIPGHWDPQQHSYKKFESRNTIIVVVVVVVFVGLVWHNMQKQITSLRASRKH